jgi:hypothetical protein
MKSLNTKLVLSAVGIALLATPAFAQRTHRQVVHPTQSQIQVPSNDVVQYGDRVIGADPDPQIRTELSRDGANSISGD